MHVKCENSKDLRASDINEAEFKKVKNERS